MGRCYVQSCSAGSHSAHNLPLYSAREFTSILLSGIRPVAELREAAIAYEFNDNDRHDGHLGGSCFSVGHPNYRMFYRCRQDNPNSHWVVLAVASDILDLVPCSYFYTNAANAVFRGIDPANLRDLVSFNSMFENIPNRDRPRDLAPKYTTDPQAEIMAFGAVEPARIISVMCMPDDIATVEKVAGGKRVYANRYVFGPRNDYANWV